MKKLFLIYTVLSTILTLAQDIQLTVQTGHASTISKVEFSPDDKLIATAGIDHKIVLWDWLTSKQYGVLLGHEQAVTEIKFTSDGKQIISSSLDSTIRFWDIATEKEVKAFKFNYPIGGFTFSPKHKNQIAVVGKRVELFNLKTKKSKTLEFVANKLFTTVDYIADGDLLSFGGEKEQFMYLVDLKENKLWDKRLSSAKDIRFYKNNSLIHCTSDGRLVETCLKRDKRKSTTTDWMLTTINAVEVNEDYIFAADNIGEVNLYSRDRKWEFAGMFKHKRGKIKDIDLSHSGKFLAVVGQNRTVVVWDVEAKEVVKSMKGKVEQINDIAFSRDGAFLIVGYNNGSVRRTNLISNQSVTNSLRPSSAIMASISGYTIEKIENHTKNNIVFKGLYRINSLVYEESYDQIKPLIIKWNVKDNFLSFEKAKDKSEHIQKYIDDLKKDIVHNNRYFLNKSLLSDFNDSIHIKTEVVGSNLKIINSDNGEVLHAIETDHSDIITSVAINPVYNFVATASWDGMIRFWDIESGDLLTVYGAFGHGQFVYLDNSGYYFASKEALDYIGFKMNQKLYSFEQFDLKYNRPDIVAKALPFYNDNYISAYYSAYQKRLSKLEISEEDIGITEGMPVIDEKEVIEKKGVDLLELKIKATDEMNQLSVLHLRVNGVPEFGRFGKAIDGQSYEETVQIKLNPGNNAIQLYVTNDRGVSSYKQSFEIESHQKGNKSEVFILAIGVSEYQQKQYNLRYAAKDAEDFIQHFKFDRLLLKNFKAKNINAQLLTNQDVTKEKLSSLKSFAKEATENDVFILFAAGHGVLDADLDYYFASHDMDFQNPKEKGIPYELFEEILDASKSRKKVMFLDACHSGEIDKEEVIENVVTDEAGEELIFRGSQRTVENKYDINSFELSRSLFADMRLNNGSTVISSAGGAEFAIEGDKWNNGVFTYCLLDGLKDKEADLNGDKIIMLSELQQYVQHKVMKITNGKQTPTSRVENLKNDFRFM